ncbi:MAG: adenosine deaminase [Chloroflexi bacterium]|nr:adenosine deaminase [Chloroflexota bacterium]
MSLKSYLQAAPKAELHVHLEGSILPATLLTLARRNAVDLPADTVAGLQSWFSYRDFHHFIEIYVTITRCLKSVADYELITYEFGAEMARQHVRYAEATFSPSTHAWLGVPAAIFLAGLAQGRRRAQQEFGVTINWVFDLVRNASPQGRARHADYTTQVAIEGQEIGVVALGLGGLETGNPPEDYQPWFDKARAAGLHSAPHAGELAGPDSIWGALRSLTAERIGHGVRAIEDPALVAYLAANAIPLEVNPTSNIRLGVYPDLESHPLRRLYDAGVILTVNSDDPPLFNTTLNDEIATLPVPFGFTLAEIDEILLNGVRHAFLPPERKIALAAEFRAEMQTLKSHHLP